jgi:hypothetical protein
MLAQLGLYTEKLRVRIEAIIQVNGMTGDE